MRGERRRDLARRHRLALVLGLFVALGAVSSIDPPEETQAAAEIVETVAPASTSTSTTVSPFEGAPQVRPTTTSTTSTTTSTTSVPPPPPTSPPPAPEPAPPPEPPPATAGACSGHQADVEARWPASEWGTACRVIACESGGNPAARNPSSSASGVWQFLDSTWRSVTGRSDRAYQAPVSVQHDAAYRLWASSGWRPWSCA